jgi:hypothetical protein
MPEEGRTSLGGQKGLGRHVKDAVTLSTRLEGKGSCRIMSFFSHREAISIRHFKKEKSMAHAAGV